MNYARRFRLKLLGMWANIWGSDVTVAYSAEYAWLSNQMSHAMMGFFLAGVWQLILLRHGGDARWSGWPQFGGVDSRLFLVFLLPVLKDTIDFGLDAWFRAGPFAVNRRELLLDGVTDNFFWSFGMMIGLSLPGLDAVNGPLLGITLVAGAIGWWLLAQRIWLPQKRMFDASRMPFNFLRLIRYRSPEDTFESKDLDALKTFQLSIASTASAPASHYALEGGRPADRSRLAVSMGCEFISHHQPVYMISAVKLMEDPDRLAEDCLFPAEFKSAIRCLIIDDVNVSLPIPGAKPEERSHTKEIVQSNRPSPERFKDLTIEQVGANMVAKVLGFVERFVSLREKYPDVTTIWVLSATTTDDREARENAVRVDAWKSFIADLVKGPLTSVALKKIP